MAVKGGIEFALTDFSKRGLYSFLNFFYNENRCLRELKIKWL